MEVRGLDLGVGGRCRCRMVWVIEERAFEDA